MTDDEQTRLAREARIKLADTVADWTAQWGDDYEGGVVTGYVLVVEVTRPGESPYATWISGSGLPPHSTDDAALAVHRAVGLVRLALAQIEGKLRKR